MVFIFDDYTFYHQIKTPIDFWYKRKLNQKFFIQLLKILQIELIKIHIEFKLKLKHFGEFANIDFFFFFLF